MTTKVQKWGNSLAIRLPIQVAEKLSLEAGSPVSISSNLKTILIKPSRQKFSLKDLLDKITPDNLHGEISSGKPRGKELW